MSTMTKLNIDAIENFSVPKFKLMDYNNYIVTYWNNDSGVNFVPNLGENEHVETIVYENGQKCVYCYKDEITTISDNAFNGCYGLVGIIIPEGVTSIGEGAFYVCGDLKDVSIPNTVTSIGKNAFAICGNLDSIIIPDSVTTIGEEAFYFCSLKNIKLSNNVTSIATNTFYGCDRLTDIIIPDSVTAIGESAFSWCNNLTNVTIGNKVATIGNSAFGNCSKIKNITFPETLTRIGESAFADCTSIATIYCKASNPPKLGTSALPAKKTSRKFYVKLNSANSYISSWSNYLYDDSVIGTIFEDEHLISGSNVKTINGQSILGTGNLFGLNLSSRVIDLEDLAYDEEYSLVLTANEYIKVNGKLPKDFYISLSSSTIDDAMVHEFIVEFRTNVKGTSVYLPSEIKWEDGIEPYFENDCDYQIRIVNNLGKCTKFDYNRSSNTTLYYRTTDNEPLADSFFTNNFSNIDGNTVGVLSHTYDYGQGVVVFDSEIAKIKYDAFYNCSRLSNMVLPYGVTEIASYAFGNCNNLESIEIPYSVTTIGSGAFKNCQKLTNIELPYGISEISSHTFEGCNNLTNITIPYSVTSIGLYAFSESGLTNIDIPYGVQYIYSNAFAHCENLKSITISDSVFSINEFSFVGCTSLEDISIGNGVTNLSANIFSDFVNLKTVYLGSGITSIEPGLFANCEKLESITFGYGITNIGFRAFENCKSLKSITCSYGLETIQEKAFAGCSSLTSVVLPDSLISIDLNAFYNCFNLSYINLGNGIQNIGTQAFFGCSSLETIYIPESLKNIGRKAFAYCSRLKSFTGHHTSNDGFAIIMHYDVTNRDVLEVFAPGCDVVDYTITDFFHEIGAYAFYAHEKLQKIYIPYGIDTIGEGAFENCYNLKTVNLSSYANVNTIGQYAFSGCYSLKTFNLEGISTLQNIGSAAFFGCSGLTEVRFPYSLMSIQDEAFAHCSGLKSVYFTGSLFNYGGYDIFKGCNALMDIYLSSFGTWFYMHFTSGENNPLSHDCRLKYSSGSNIRTQINPYDKPEDVYEINDYLFYKYKHLQDILLSREFQTDENANNSFMNLTSIGQCAFYGCVNTRNVILGEHITNIGTNAFFDCGGSVTVNKYILDNGFENALSGNKFTIVHIVPYEVGYETEIGDGSGEISIRPIAIPSYFLSGNNIIEMVRIGTHINYTGSHTFENCRNLQEILKISDTVTGIGEWAFYGCQSLTNVTIPDSVVMIGDSAFRSCTSLTSINIPDSATMLGNYVFSGCTNLQMFDSNFASEDNRCLIVYNTLLAFAPAGLTGEYTIPNNVSTIGSGTFESCLLSSIIIPDSVTTIEDYAFLSCENIITMTIPDSVTTIGDYAFSRCVGLTSINIGNGVETIGKSVFYNNLNLSSVIIGNSVASIGDYVFNGCVKLRSIRSYSENAPSLGASVFQGVSKEGTLFCSGTSDYTSWLTELNSYEGNNWVRDIVFVPETYKELYISASDVSAREAYTTIKWDCLCDGHDGINGNVVTDRTIGGYTLSMDFGKNYEASAVEREIVLNLYGLVATTTIQQEGWKIPTYQIDFNDQWKYSTTNVNTNTASYDGNYESYSNKSISDSSAVMYIDFEGYEIFAFEMQNRGPEISYGVASQLDKVIDYTTDIQDSELVREILEPVNSNIWSEISYPRTYGKPHRVSIMYKKTTHPSSHSTKDCSYVRIPKPILPFSNVQTFNINIDGTYTYLDSNGRCKTLLSYLMEKFGSTNNVGKTFNFIEDERIIFGATISISNSINPTNASINPNKVTQIEQYAFKLYNDLDESKYVIMRRTGENKSETTLYFQLPLITFTIIKDGIEYEQYSTGTMTWGEWVNSNLNVNGCFVGEDGADSNLCVYWETDYIITKPDSNFALSSDLIEGDVSYTTTYNSISQ